MGDVRSDVLAGNENDYDELSDFLVNINDFIYYILYLDARSSTERAHAEHLTCGMPERVYLDARSSTKRAHAEHLTYGMPERVYLDARSSTERAHAGCQKEGLNWQ